MNKDTDKFIQDLRTISLSKTDEQVIRVRLESYADAHPVSTVLVQQKNPYRFLSPFSYLLKTPMTNGFALLLVIMFFGVSVAGAAEGALPGDALYPVKIHVNEGLKTALTINETERSLWDAARAERRIDEAIKLAAKGALTGSVETYITDQFEQHATAALARAVALEQRGDIKAAYAIQSKLEVHLGAYTNVLQSLTIDGANPQKELAGLLIHVYETSVFAARARTDQEQLDTEHQVTKDTDTLFAAEQAIQKIREEIKNETERNADGKTIRAAKIRLKNAESFALDARAALDTQSELQADDLARKAEKSALEAQILMKNKKLIEANTDINIRDILYTNGDIPTSPLKHILDSNHFEIETNQTIGL